MNDVEIIKDILMKRNLKLSCGESCTGGLISSILTDVSGASGFIEINFVTYSPYAKTRFLNVSPSIIEKYGVVSSETAAAMARGLLKYSGISISTTGYLGPVGGDKNNPIGTVYYGFAYKDIIISKKYVSNKNDRIQIKNDIVKHVIQDFVTFLKENIQN